MPSHVNKHSMVIETAPVVALVAAISHHSDPNVFKVPCASEEDASTSVDEVGYDADGDNNDSFMLG